MDIKIGIDASQHITSCAVSVGKDIIAHSTVDKPIENLTGLIHDTLLAAHVDLQKLTEIVACIGPGSNMGSRATVVTGNALALALNIPITGILSTDALCVFSPFKGKQIVAIPAGRGRWYKATYDYEEDKIIRTCMPELVDQLPETSSIPVFTANDYRGDFICADGLIRVSNEQKQLSRQLLLSEIRTYEQGDQNV